MHELRAQRQGLVRRERKRSLTIILIASAVIALAGSAIGPKVQDAPAGASGTAGRQAEPGADTQVSPLKAIGRRVQQAVPKGSLAARVLSADGSNETKPPETEPEKSPPQTCPQPSTCVRFKYGGTSSAGNSPRWPKSGGVATVRYRINPSGALTNLSTDQIVAAIKTSFATWERAAPSVRFVYEGTTTSPPIRDGQNVVGFTSLRPEQTLGHSEVIVEGANIIEADMELAVPQAETISSGATMFGWTWKMCGGSSGPCTAIQQCDVNALGVRRCYNDIQNVVTHEAGHWLWLADLKEADAVDMTMFWSVDRSGPDGPSAERKKSTLAMGDVVAARALYPCDCSPPSIAAP